MAMRRRRTIVAAWLLLSAAAPTSRGRATLLYEIHGEGKLGWSVAGIGDVDGDSVPDFAAGAPEAGAGFGAGEVRVFSGATGTPVAALDGVLQGLQGGGFLGRAVAPAGDVDGDGVPDVLAGASSVATASALPGYVVVFSGANGAMLLRIDGASATERFGDAVASVGDVNGDGVPDVLVGAPGTTGVGAGFAAVFSGKDAGLIRRHDAESPGENLGAGVAGLGDVDGDGVGDYAVGAPRFGAGTGATGTGYVKVFSGATGAALARIAGRDGDQLGSRVAGPGDLDGDGKPDLLATAIGLAGRGGVLGFNVARARPKKILSIVWPFSGRLPFFGSGLAGIEDVTGDGRPDVAVGAEGVGLAAVFAGRGGVPVFAHFGASADVVGDAVASGGDMNGDGVPEIVVGGWGASVVRVFALERVAPPKRLASRVTLTPSGGGQGTVTLSAKGKRVAVKFKLARLSPGTYQVFLEDAPGSATFFAVADVVVSASGKGTLTLAAKVLAPEPLKVLSLVELAGRSIEVRDGSGVVALSGVVPPL